MNTKRWIAVGIAVLAMGMFFSPQSTFAQTRVAIVDIGKIFKNHPSFSQQLEALKQEADAFKASSIQAQQDLIQKAEVLKNLTPGSPDYKTEEAKLAEESASMEVKQKLQMRDLMQAEAKLHYDTYQQVNSLIEQYCDSQGILLVLRYNSQEMDPSNPVISYNLSCYWALNGNVSQCCDYLVLAIELDEKIRDLVDDEPDFDSVRSHPQFLSVISALA